MPVKWNQDLAFQIEDAAFRGVVKGTNRVRNEVIRLIMRTKKTGKIYVVGGVKRRASAPGEPPANQTKNLVNGIEARYDRATLTGTVNSSAEYAAALEYGRLDGTIAERPHMRPALANTRDGVLNDVAKEVQKVVGGDYTLT